MARVDSYPVKFFLAYSLAFILTNCINVDVRINAGRHKKKEIVWFFIPTLARFKYSCGVCARSVLLLRHKLISTSITFVQ